MIEVKDLYKGFLDVEVLKGISTTFHPGQTSPVSYTHLTLPTTAIV